MPVSPITASNRRRDVPAIKAPLLLQYAGLDERINAGIDAYKKALEENGKTFEIFVYDGVNHAFNNDTSSARYDKAAVDLAWGRTTEFFKNIWRDGVLVRCDGQPLKSRSRRRQPRVSDAHQAGA